MSCCLGSYALLPMPPFCRFYKARSNNILSQYFATYEVVQMLRAIESYNLHCKRRGIILRESHWNALLGSLSKGQINLTNIRLSS